MHDPDLVARAGGFHPWDAMAPAALAGILQRGPFRASAETGCGGSTIVLSRASDRHIAFAIEGADRTITELGKHIDLRTESVIFVEGETKDTLPGYHLEHELDVALLDGPHAYPLSQIEFAYLYPRIRLGGWLVIDDIQIPSVYELFRFLEREPSVVLEEVAVRTAFFRKASAGGTVAGRLGVTRNESAHHLALFLARSAAPAARRGLRFGGLRYARGHFDFDLHARIGKAGRDHGGRGTDFAEVPAQHCPAWLEIFDSWNNVANPDHVGDTAPRIRQSLFDVEHALLRLCHHIVRDGHRFVIETGGARNKHPVSVHNGTRIADVPFETRSRRNQAAHT